MNDALLKSRRRTLLTLSVGSFRNCSIRLTNANSNRANSRSMLAMVVKTNPASS